VLLNCEPDHLDYYKDEEDYVSAFVELCKKVPKDGFIVYNRGDKNASRAAKSSTARLIGASMTEAKKTDIKLKILGSFNQLNALHALRAAEALRADSDKVMRALENFKGAWRRMEFKGLFQGAPVYDDYGHHPMSIKPMLEAFKNAHAGKRLICVYQPHQYSRTHQLLEGFKTAFGAAHVLMVPNIYAARDTEEDKKKIDAKRFVQAIGKHHPDARWTENFDKTFELLKKEVTANDVVIIAGAGNITELADRLVAA
jgi:UDP-N-acetylmuramate--alanine ligase